ncbi:replication factor C subunit 1 [Guillardia theta CCMP2712]|uniref:Replication factor C subunit 1 n=1 Tax=Guillardia theta (strain CCMP2712) TaxID=905079 RepID=L1K313_GUITC|nr:replication factor C subunit 1 [Guillardia theta CCMP2712]EKX54825.1 replication factor C subunit 1 [Guillardia theta CCMP2712]|eukprot:XP_005841805.1 replication factor C subunit 1 [Guillardia theta CCMP2712]
MLHEEQQAAQPSTCSDDDDDDCVYVTPKQVVPSWEVLRANLKLLADVKEGDKLVIAGDTVRIDSAGMFGSVTRWLSSQGRTQTLAWLSRFASDLSRFQSLLQAGVGVSTDNFAETKFHSRTRDEVVNDLRKELTPCIDGLKRLRNTYNEDRWAVQRLDKVISDLSQLQYEMHRARGDIVAMNQGPMMRIKGGGREGASGKREMQGEAEGSKAKKAKTAGGFFYVNRKPPPHYGTKPIPTGDPDCLKGMQFVISGVLDSLEREEAAHLIQTHGGKVVSAVSGKVTHALVGEEAGETKMKKIREMGTIKTLTEDELLNLISSSRKGHTNQVKLITNWLKGFLPESKGSNQDGKQQNIILMTGPPGLGKTTIAHVLANFLGFEIVEINASDDRSADEIDQVLGGMMGNQPITNFFAPRGTAVVKKSKPLLLIMDEVDGMTSGEKGGVQKLIQLATSKRDRLPIICICNDEHAKALRIRFYHLKGREVLPRLKEVCRLEQFKNVEDSALLTIAEIANGDLRTMINILQLARSSSDVLTLEMVDPSWMVRKKYMEMGKTHESLTVFTLADSFFKVLGMWGRGCGEHGELSIAKQAKRNGADLWMFIGLETCVFPGYYLEGKLEGRMRFPTKFARQRAFERDKKMKCCSPQKVWAPNEVGQHASLLTFAPVRRHRIPELAAWLGHPMEMAGTNQTLISIVAPFVVDSMDAHGLILEDLEFIMRMDDHPPNYNRYLNFSAPMKSAVEQIYYERHGKPGKEIVRVGGQRKRSKDSRLSAEDSSSLRSKQEASLESSKSEEDEEAGEDNEEEDSLARLREAIAEETRDLG